MSSISEMSEISSLLDTLTSANDVFKAELARQQLPESSLTMSEPHPIDDISYIPPPAMYEARRLAVASMPEVAPGEPSGGRHEHSPCKRRNTGCAPLSRNRSVRDTSPRARATSGERVEVTAQKTQIHSMKLGAAVFPPPALAQRNHSLAAGNGATSPCRCRRTSPRTCATAGQRTTRRTSCLSPCAMPVPAFEHTFQSMEDMLRVAGTRIKKVYATRSYVRVTEVESS